MHTPSLNENLKVHTDLESLISLLFLSNVFKFWSSVGSRLAGWAYRGMYVKHRYLEAGTTADPGLVFCLQCFLSCGFLLLRPMTTTLT